MVDFKRLTWRKTGSALIWRVQSCASSQGHVANLEPPPSPPLLPPLFPSSPPSSPPSPPPPISMKTQLAFQAAHFTEPLITFKIYCCWVTLTGQGTEFCPDICVCSCYRFVNWVPGKCLGLDLPFDGEDGERTGGWLRACGWCFSVCSCTAPSAVRGRYKKAAWNGQ